MVCNALWDEFGLRYIQIESLLQLNKTLYYEYFLDDCGSNYESSVTFVLTHVQTYDKIQYFQVVLPAGGTK